MANTVSRILQSLCNSFLIIFLSFVCIPCHAQSGDDAYRNMVNTLGKQNQEELTQTVKQQLSTEAPPLPVIQPPTATPTVAAPTPAGNAKALPAKEATPPLAVPQTPTVPLASPSTTTVVTVPTTPLPSAKETQQIYTGFGNPNQKDQKSSQEKSAGWKIQY